MSTSNCTIYIDEAGDLGVGKGTQWFVLTAVIINKDDEKQIRETMGSIKRELNLDTIHFRALRNFEQKAYVVKELSNSPFEYINVILDTHKLDLGKLRGKRSDFSEKPSIILYNHACRYLIERVSWLLRDTQMVGDVVLSSRGTSRDGELIEYLNDKLIHYGNNEVSNQFDKIYSKTAASWDMLQLADICATSMFYYHEINRYGFVMPCFTYKLRNALYRRNGKILKYGMKYYTDIMEPEDDYFINRMICK